MAISQHFTTLRGVRSMRPVLLRRWIVLAVVLIPTSAQPGSGKKTTPCVATDARFAIGELYSPQLAERARKAAGAESVREALQAGPTAAQTIPQRLNLGVDHRGIVRRVTCG